MNLSINTTPAKMAASAILSALPIRSFLLNHVRRRSLFSQRSSIKKTEFSGGEKKGNEKHKNNVQERKREEKKKTHYVDLTGQDYDNGRSEGGEAIVKAV